MNMKDIIEWRDTSRLSVKLDENDLIKIDWLINEVERLSQKDKCFSCRFWKSSQESYRGYCSIGKEYHDSNNKCLYGSWRPSIPFCG